MWGRRRMSMPSSRLRVLNLGEALNRAIHSFSSVRRLMTFWGVRLENCHSQGVPFCTEMDGHRRVLIVLNGVPVAVHSLVQSATSLSDVRSVASGAADEVNNRRGLASKWVLDTKMLCVTQIDSSSGQNCLARFAAWLPARVSSWGARAWMNDSGTSVRLGVDQEASQVGWSFVGDQRLTKNFAQTGIRPENRLCLFQKTGEVRQPGVPCSHQRCPLHFAHLLFALPPWVSTVPYPVARRWCGSDIHASLAAPSSPSSAFQKWHLPRRSRASAGQDYTAGCGVHVVDGCWWARGIGACLLLLWRDQWQWWSSPPGRWHPRSLLMNHTCR